MSHPNESKLIDRFLDDQADPEIDRHLEDCSECRAKMERLEKARERLLGQPVPDCEAEFAEDAFAAAWTGSRGKQTQGRSLFGSWNWGLQPAALFMAGLFFGYLLFSNPGNAPEAVGPPPDDREIGQKERTGPPTDLEDLNKDKQAAPQTAQVPGAESDEFPPTPNDSEYWERAGFKNAKFTPTFRYEGNRKVLGARLEAETPGGALVVMNY